jgi:hypothetical protein
LAADELFALELEVAPGCLAAGGAIQERAASLLRVVIQELRESLDVALAGAVELSLLLAIQLRPFPARCGPGGARRKGQVLLSLHLPSMEGVASAVIESEAAHGSWVLESSESKLPAKSLDWQ